VTSAWELLATEQQGQGGRRPVPAKTCRLPDGTQAAFTVTGDPGVRALPAPRPAP
jgi:hypothetical protein